MGDLKSVFSNAVYPTTSDLAGDTVVSRGSDPNADGNPGPAALKDFWEKGDYPWPAGTPGQAVSEDTISQAESANSMSGLPSLPNRFEPSEGAVEPPDLTNRNPGTIDKQ